MIHADNYLKACRLRSMFVTANRWPVYYQRITGPLADNVVLGRPLYSWIGHTPAMALHKTLQLAREVDLLSSSGADLSSNIHRALVYKPLIRELSKVDNPKPQKHLYSFFCDLQREYITANLITAKLSHFGLRSRQLFKNIKHCSYSLKGRVPPRVLASLFLLWNNAWVTSRRTGNRLGSRCKFCQATFSECSIEHYAFCQVIKVLGNHFLNTPRRYTREEFFCLRKESPEVILQRACHVHVVKRCVDFLRHNPLSCPILAYRAQVWHLSMAKPIKMQYKLSAEGLAWGDQQSRSLS